MGESPINAEKKKKEEERRRKNNSQPPPPLPPAPPPAAPPPAPHLVTFFFFLLLLLAQRRVQGQLAHLHQGCDNSRNAHHWMQYMFFNRHQVRQWNQTPPFTPAAAAATIPATIPATASRRGVAMHHHRGLLMGPINVHHSTDRTAVVHHHRPTQFKGCHLPTYKATYKATQKAQRVSTTNTHQHPPPLLSSTYMVASVVDPDWHANVRLLGHHATQHVQRCDGTTNVQLRQSTTMKHFFFFPSSSFC